MAWGISYLGLISRNTHTAFATLCDTSSPCMHMLKRTAAMFLRSVYYIRMSRNNRNVTQPTVISHPAPQTPYTTSQKHTPASSCCDSIVEYWENTPEPQQHSSVTKQVSLLMLWRLPLTILILKMLYSTSM